MSKIQELINSIKSTEWELRYTPEVNYYKREWWAANSKDYQDTASLYKNVLRQSSIETGKETIAQDKINENALKRLNEAVSYTNYRTPEPRELVLGSWILPNKQPQSIAKIEKPVSSVSNSKKLLQSLKSAPWEFVQSSWKMLWATWDFWSRTTQQAANLLSPFLNTWLISTFKALWDKDLANVSYDDIWRNEIKWFEDRVIEIWKPTAYFESLITQDNPQESQLFMWMANSIANKTNEAINKWDTKWIIEWSAKLAWIWFMREFANVWWTLWELTKVETPMKSFKLDDPKTLMRFTIKPSWTWLIWSKVKVEPYTEIYKLELKWKTPYITEAWKVVAPKTPEVYVIWKLNKDWSTTIRVINKWWEILNKNIISNLVRWTEWTSAVSKLGWMTWEILPAAASKWNIMSRVAAITQASKMALPAPRITDTVKDTWISTEPLLEAPVAPGRIIAAPNRTSPKEKIASNNNVFPESKVKKTLYHWTKEDFDTFDITKTWANTEHANSKWWIFFSDKPKLSKDFVEMTKGSWDTRPTKIIEASVNIKNPLDLTLKWLFSNKKQAPIIYEVMTWEKLSPDEALEMIEENVWLWDIGDFFEELYWNVANKKLFQKAWYDWIIAEMWRDGDKIYKEYVAFEPSQVKINNKRVEWDSIRPEKKIIEKPKTSIIQDTIEQEARKYNSADEFVKAQTIYRGQPEGFKFRRATYDVDASNNILIGKGVFTTTDKKMAETYGKNILEFKKPTEKVLDISNASINDLKKLGIDDNTIKVYQDTLKSTPPATVLGQSVEFNGKTYKVFRKVNVGGQTMYELQPTKYGERIINKSIDEIEKIVKPKQNLSNVKDAEDILMNDIIERFTGGKSVEELLAGGSSEAGKLKTAKEQASKWLNKQGYNFVKHQGGIRAGGGKELHDVYIALSDEALKPQTKSQLIDIWNKVQPAPKTVKETALKTVDWKNKKIPIEEETREHDLWITSNTKTFYLADTISKGSDQKYRPTKYELKTVNIPWQEQTQELLRYKLKDGTNEFVFHWGNSLKSLQKRAAGAGMDKDSLVDLAALADGNTSSSWYVSFPKEDIGAFAKKHQDWVESIASKKTKPGAETKTKDEIDLKFRAERDAGKTPSQIFAEKSKAAQERFKAKSNVAKIVEDAKKPKDLTIRKKDIKPVEKKVKKEATEAELIHDINKAELDMDKYEIWDPRWEEAAMKHAALSIKYESLTWKSLMDNILDDSVDSKIKQWTVDPSFTEEYDSFLSYKKWKSTKLKEIDELEKEFDLLRKKYPEEYARIDWIVERWLKIQSWEIRFNLQEEIEKGIRELWLKITRTKNPRAAEYYSKWVIAIRSIHDVPSIVHWVAHSYFDTKKIDLESLPIKAQEELKAYAEIKWLGKIDEWNLLVRKEVLPFFIEDVVKISWVKAKYYNIYKELFKKDWSLYDEDTVAFYNRMEENIRLYTILTPAKKAESLMFAWPKSMSFRSRLKLFKKKNSYVRWYDKTQQVLIDETHWAKVADRSIAEAFWEKVDYNKPFLDFTTESWEKYNSLHRLSRWHDKLLRYAESNLVYNPSRPWTWTLDINWNPKKISEYSIWELNHDLDTMSMSIKKDWSASTMIRREFWALLISRRFSAFKQNQKLLESNLEKAKETIKEIKYKAKALRDAYPMITDDASKKKVNKKIYKYRLEVRNLKKYVESEKAWIKKMKEMIEADHMSIEEREIVVRDLEPKYKEQLKKYDDITKAEINLLHEEWLVTDAQRDAYSKQWWYATFLRSTLEDFKNRFSVKKKNASSTKTKEIDANDSAIVNPLDSMPYLQMETMREYSYQRFLNELYKRKKLWLVADLWKWDLTWNTVWAYKAYVKWDKWEWSARTFRILEPDNLLSDSIESIFMIESFSPIQRVLNTVLWNPARIFQKLTTTFNLYFALFRNILLDIGTSSLLTKTWYVPIISQISEIVKSIRSETYRKALLQNFSDYKAMWWFDMSKSYVDPRHVDVEKVIWNMLRSKWLRNAIIWGNPLKIVKEIVRLIPRWLKTLSAITETFTRFTEFQRAVNKWYSKLDAMELASRVSWAFDRRWSQAKKAFRYMNYVNAAFQLAEQNISAWAQMFKWDKNKMARFAALVWLYSTIAYLAVKEKTDKVKNAVTEEERELALEELFSYMDKAVYKKLWFAYLWKLKSWKEFKISVNPSFSAPWVLLAQKEIKDLFPFYEADYKEIALSWLGWFFRTGIAPEEMSWAWIMWRVLWVTPLSSTLTWAAWYRVYPVLSEINTDNDKKDPSAAFTKDTNRLAVWFSNTMMPEVSPKQIEQVLRSSTGSLWYIIWDILWSLALTDSQYKALWLTPYSTRELLLDRPLKSYMIEDAWFMSSWGKLTTDMHDRIKAMEEHKLKLEKIWEAKMDLLESWVEIRDEDLEDLMLLTEAYWETDEWLKILNKAREVSTYIKDWNNSWVLKEMTTTSERNAIYRFLASFLSWKLENTSQEDFWVLEMIRAWWSALKESSKVKLK